jgi:hypothetical protein
VHSPSEHDCSQLPLDVQPSSQRPVEQFCSQRSVPLQVPTHCDEEQFWVHDALSAHSRSHPPREQSIVQVASAPQSSEHAPSWQRTSTLEPGAAVTSQGELLGHWNTHVCPASHVHAPEHVVASPPLVLPAGLDVELPPPVPSSGTCQSRMHPPSAHANAMATGAWNLRSLAGEGRIGVEEAASYGSEGATDNGRARYRTSSAPQIAGSGHAVDVAVGAAARHVAAAADAVDDADVGLPAVDVAAASDAVDVAQLADATRDVALSSDAVDLAARGVAAVHGAAARDAVDFARPARRAPPVAVAVPVAVVHARLVVPMVVPIVVAEVNAAAAQRDDDRTEDEDRCEARVHAGHLRTRRASEI